MNDRLPPLTALRAFEAAARHMSFAEAAAELHVTPAALSFQIKSLEEHLGAPVFRRLNRRVELTDIGAGLVPGVQEGFEALQAAWSNALRRLDQGHLTVTAGPAFMAGFLAPRMSKFVTAYPDLELRFTASLKILNFQRDGIDLAIRFGPSSDEGYFSERLFHEWATPMMSPELAYSINTLDDLRNHTLIRQTSGDILSSIESWTEWFKATDTKGTSTRGPQFSSPDSALNYAANGGGIVLGRVSLAETYLNSGRLVAPFKEVMHKEHYYRLVCPLGMENDPNVVIFREWMREEIKSLDDFSKGRVFV
ncbi:transcriptional regulator GcvA [Amylibacter sp. SFDW26]|uniref:transcriptional regulator GcvA n=1 Tax=Amylibacter sp. SFDW26 TaxID=2652722 RepID=UPI0012624A3D|nr:transcriptional regulator GcvA [Amylibacter sp. SFDW26]KAB7615306.1 transcriptional regulator GcvA [Amylibacter sp. SFDW26]